MACNTCAKSFSILRQEKGCPGCGFSYCSKCLNNKIFLKKINSEAKVCVKCKRKAEEGEANTITPPDAYYKRVRAFDTDSNGENICIDSQDQQILERLKKLKEKPSPASTVGDIESRLQKLKGDAPAVSDNELHKRLANIKGIPVAALQSKPVVLTTDTRTEQEQIDDLLKQYSEQANIDSKYTEEFDGVISDIESRLQKLKGASSSSTQEHTSLPAKEKEVEDDEAYVKKIIEKLKSEELAEKEDEDLTIKELPFCELCNEDAKMRCRGCKYLFCKACFMEHQDDDDGCDSYDLYTPS